MSQVCTVLGPFWELELDETFPDFFFDVCFQFRRQLTTATRSLLMLSQSCNSRAMKKFGLSFGFCGPFLRSGRRSLRVSTSPSHYCCDHTH